MNQPKNKKTIVKQEESLFIQLFSRYIFYWPLFLALALIFGIASFIYLRYATPLYEANATMIIKDEKKGTENSKGVDELNIINSKKIIENEIEVLQSRSIMENVVRNLHLYAPISQEGKIRTLSAYTLSPVSIIVNNPDEIIEAKNIKFKYEKSSGKIFLNDVYSGKLNEWITTPYATLKFVPNKNYRPSNLQKPFEFSLFSVKEMTMRLLNALQITSENKLSSIISLSYKDEVPKRSEDILNELIAMYDQAAVNEKNSLAKNTLQFVNERLNAVAIDLNSIERTVQKYKAGRGAQDISTQGQLYLQNVSSNDQELGKINTQLAVLNQVENAVSKGNGSSLGINPSSIGINDAGLTQMISELNNKELEYEKLKKTVAENNPMLVSIRDQINKLKPDIQNNLANQRKSLEISQSNIMRTNNAYNSMLSSIPQKERDILEISRDQNVKNGIYSFLLQKKEESELSYASNLSDSRVINSAQASKYPVSPNKKLIFIGALLASIFLGILFITAKDFLSSKILYRKDLESMTAIPVLGEIAQNDSTESIVIEAGKRSFIAEEFRKIRASLHFLGINNTNKKILITSSIPGEGKSFVSGNFAISNALSGKKVCLVDIDLHNPGLGKMFGKNTADPGISDYLNGKKEADDIIKKVANFENLFFVSSGTLHESPSDLLLNGKIETFIAYLETKFDMVILDTAPSVLITDAYYLTNLCDATLYIVRHNHTPKMIIKRMDETLEINPLKNIAIIFNGVKKRGFFKNNYGYGYDYVYGGKYGPVDDKTKKQKKQS
jgi:capsular exopolysaccharide synthesis family protein